MPLIRLALDFETFYSTRKDPATGKAYSLRNMTVPEYVFDPQFEVIGMSIRTDEGPLNHLTDAGFVPDFRAVWIPANLIPAALARMDPKKYALDSHNILFDGTILAWKYGWVPALYIDTLGMARATQRAFLRSCSLDSLLKHFGLPEKGKDIVRADGLRLADFERIEAAGGTQFKEFREYCCRDTDGAAWLLAKMAKDMVPTEYIIMDTVVRMAIQPQLLSDSGVLRNHLKKVQDAKRSLVQRLSDMLLGPGIVWPEDPTSDEYQRLYAASVGRLRSDETLAAVFEGLGVEPPTKWSEKQQKEVYAFAKSDRAFMDMQEDPDPDVQALVTSRLGVKTTLEESRTERMIAISELDWGQQCHPGGMLPAVRNTDPHVEIQKRVAADMGSKHTGWIFPLPAIIGALMPVPLAYGAAHTHRLGGDWKINYQNFSRDSDIKKGIIAPPGHLIVQADASQIECRTDAELAGCVKLTAQFRRKEDVYSSFASSAYGYEVAKATHPDQRFVGKTCVLGLGFGMGAPKLKTTVWTQSKGKQEIDISFAEACVKTFRMEYHEIPKFWKACENMIQCMVIGQDMDYGPFKVRGQSIILPNGMRLYYHNIRYEQVPNKFGPGTMKQAVFEYGGETKYIFGGKLCENLVQATARIMTMMAMYRIRMIHKCPFPCAYQVHDALGYVVPESEAMWMAQLIVDEMRKPPEWLPNIPLDAEASIGPNYKDMKEVKGL